MDLILIISGFVVTIITTVITTFFMNKNKRKNLDANTESLIVTSSQNALKMMQSQLESQQLQIEVLTAKVNELEFKEKIHNKERNYLKQKVEELKNANEQLKALSKADEEEIFRLRKEIEKLTLRLNS